MANENLAILKVDGLVIDFSEQSVTYMNEEISFTNREFQVLYFLTQYRGQVFSKRQIGSFQSLLK